MFIELHHISGVQTSRGQYSLSLYSSVHKFVSLYSEMKKGFPNVSSSTKVTKYVFDQKVKYVYNRCSETFPNNLHVHFTSCHVLPSSSFSSSFLIHFKSGNSEGHGKPFTFFSLPFCSSSPWWILSVSMFLSFGLWSAWL